LGWWRTLAEICVHQGRQDDTGHSFFVRELPDFVLRTLVPAVGSNEGESGTPQFLPLRNNLFHIKWFLDRNTALGLVNSYQETFFNLIMQLDFWRSYSLLGIIRSLAAAKLNGQFLETTTALNPDHPPVEHVIVVRNNLASGKGDYLDLYPLLAVEPPASQDVTGPPVLDLYLRRTGSELSYSRFTAINPCPDASQVERNKHFRSWLPLDEWRRELVRAKEPWVPASFQPFIDELSENFCGRTAAVDGAESPPLQIAVTRATASTEGVLWLSGSPGVGKTAFMAKLATMLGRQPATTVIPYFFRTGEAGHSAEEFYRYSLFHLRRPGQAKARKGTVEDPQQILLTELEERSREFTRGGSKVLFLLDGLDEIFRWQPAFVSFLAQAKIPGIVWFCAGRSEEELDQFLTRQNAQWIFEGGLPSMSESDVGDMIIRRTDRRTYEALADEAFIPTLTKKSGGLPLYLDLAIQDFNKNEWGTGQVDRLPQGLDAYFKLLRERWHLHDVGSLMPPTFCLISWAREPITETTLLDLLTRHHLAYLPGFADLLQAALRRAHTMLRPAPTAEGTPGLVPYHESFREHLLSDPDLRLERDWARTQWVEQGSHWQETGNADLRQYLLRHYSWHLLNEQRWEKLYSLALNPDLWKRQNDSIPDAPELSLRTIRDGIAGAIASDDPVVMGKLVLAHAQRAAAIRSESPVSALRRTSLRRAFALADLREPDARACWHLLIAWDQLDAGESSDAATTLDRLDRLVLPDYSPSTDLSLVNMLLAITCKGWTSGVQFLAVCQKMVPRFYFPGLIAWLSQRGQLDYASRLAEDLGNGRQKAESLADLAGVHFQAGNLAEARKLLDAALREEKEQNEYTLETIAQGLASVAATDWALEVANSIQKKPVRASALAEISAQLFEKQPELSAKILDDAKQLAEAVLDDPEAESSLEKIAKVLLKADRLPDVSSLAAQTKHVGSAVRLLCASAEFQHERLQIGDALQSLSRARQAANAGINPKERGDWLNVVAESYAKIGQYDLALAIAEEIEPASGEEKPSGGATTS